MSDMNDGYHSATRPQDSLKGGMAAPISQAPMTSEAQTNPRSAGVDNIGQSWDSSSLQPGHTKLNPPNKAPVH